MKRKSMMKKTIAAFILTAFLSVTLSAAEAAPGRKVYPYPVQQQGQQSSRPASHQPRPVSQRPTMQQSRPVSQRPTMQQSRPVSQRPTVQQPRPVSQRPTMHQPKPASQHQTMHQPKPASQRPTMHQPKPASQHQTMQQPKPVSQHQTMQQPKHTEVSREKLRPKTHDPQQNVTSPKAHDPKQDVAKPKTHDLKQSVSKPKAHDPKQNVAKPKDHDPKNDAAKPKNHEPKRYDSGSKIHEQRKNVSKQEMHGSEYRKHRKPGPRKDLHRPPVERTYENMHVWRRDPKPPEDHWWNHRPAHRRGRYRGYYNGIYYTDVVSALLAAEIIHSTYAVEPASVIYSAEDSVRAFIPKEAIKYKGHHYQVFSDIGNTMEDAQQFCESMGGHLAAVGDDEMNERMYRLINESGYDNEYFEKFGHYRMIPNEPVTYVKADQESNSEEELFYGLYYWNYKNLTEDGTAEGTGGNAFVCEWDK